MCCKMDVYVIVLYYIYPNLSLFIHCLKSHGSVRLLRKYLMGLEVLTAVVKKIHLLGCDTVSIGKYLLLFWSSFLSPSSLPVTWRRQLQLWRCNLVGHLTPEDNRQHSSSEHWQPSTSWHSVTVQNTWVFQKVACLDKSFFSILLPLHMICGSEVILQYTAINSGLSDTKDLAVWIMSPKLLFEVVVKLFTLFN